MRNLNLLLFLALVPFMSCSYYPLSQSTINIPLADTCKVVKIATDITTTGADLQMSYTINKHLLVAANFNDCFIHKYSLNGYSDGSYSADPKNLDAEAAGGYYLAKYKDGETNLFEVMGGLGYGTVATSFLISYSDHGMISNLNQNINGVFRDAFLQADVGRVSDHVEYGLGIQLKQVFFDGSNLVSGGSTAMNGNHDASGNSFICLMGARFAYRFPDLNLRFAFGFTTTPSIGPQYGFMASSPFYISAGIAARILTK